jgi:hypothetical protein
VGCFVVVLTILSIVHIVTLNLRSFIMAKLVQEEKFKTLSFTFDNYVNNVVRARHQTLQATSNICKFYQAGTCQRGCMFLYFVGCVYLCGND